jgi:hypothetical protein
MPHAAHSTHRRLAAPLVAVALALPCLAGCGLGSAKDLPPDYKPLEPTNLATFPTSPDDPHPEMLSTVKGKDMTTGDSWAHGRGYVKAPITTVWTALQNADVVVDRRELTKWEVTQSGFDMIADYSFMAHLYTNSSPSVDYVIEWRSKALEGSKDAPTQVFARDDLVQSAIFFDITLMTTLSDTVIINIVDPNTSTFEVIRHRNTVQGNPDDAERYIQDLFNSVVASVHGAALPTYTK